MTWLHSRATTNGWRLARSTARSRKTTGSAKAARRRCEATAVESAGDLPPAHVAWLRARPLSWDDGRRFFVHAGIDPARPLAEQRERDLIWIRERFLRDRRDHGRLIVHGHTPAADGMPEVRPNRVNLDTGAVYGGPLTAAVFSDASTEPEAFLQVDQALAASVLPALRRT